MQIQDTNLINISPNDKVILNNLLKNTGFVSSQKAAEDLKKRLDTQGATLPNNEKDEILSNLFNKSKLLDGDTPKRPDIFGLSKKLNGEFQSVRNILNSISSDRNSK